MSSSQWELHVAPSGKDSADGASDRPFGTLERARDEIRSRKASGNLPPGGVMVRVHAGDYLRKASFELTETDSGTDSSPITYCALEGARVRFIGGVILHNFSPVDDAAIRTRLNPSVRDKVRQADLKEHGVVDYGELRSRGFGRNVVPAHAELFVGDRPMALAQFPQPGEFLKITGFTKPMTDEWNSTTGDLTGGFTYDSERPLSWAQDDDIWVHGYWSYDWANSYEHVSRLDPENRTVQTHPPHGNYSFRTGQRFYFLNVLEELDAPGEYYLDRKQGKVFFLPPEGCEHDEALLSVLETPILSMHGVKHVSLRGLSFECSRGDGLSLVDCDHVNVVGCAAKNLGNCGIVVEGGSHVTIAGCAVYNNGDGGLRVTGGDRKTLTPGNHTVDNNHIHHIARWSRCYQTAVNVNGVGHRVSHNLIHDLPHTAILFWGNDITIENNDIYSVCLETGDAGAIYTGRDFTFRGNVIQRNFVHHTGGVGMGSMAVYMDDCVCGTEIRENIFWDVTRAVFLGGGRDFHVTNNVFVDCRPAVELDSRGTSDHPVWRKMVNGFMRERFDEMSPLDPPFSVRYPEIAAIRPYLESATGVPAEGNVVARNVCVGEWLRVQSEAVPLVEVHDNLVETDPRFTEPEYGVFALADNSPAFSLGFSPIPMGEIGLAIDENRTATPPRVATRIEHVGTGERNGIRVYAKNLAEQTAAATVNVRATGGDTKMPVLLSRWTFSLAPGEIAWTDLPMPESPSGFTVDASSETPDVRPSRVSIKNRV